MRKKENQLKIKITKRTPIALSLNQFEIAAVILCMMLRIRNRRFRLMICRVRALIGLFSSLDLGNATKRILKDMKAKRKTDTNPVPATLNHASFALPETSLAIESIILTPIKLNDAIAAETTHRVLKKGFVSSCMTIHSKIRPGDNYTFRLQLLHFYSATINDYGGIVQWLAYQIFVKSPDDIEQLILSVVKELKKSFLKDGLIDTYHFLTHFEKGKSWVVFRLGKEKDIDEKTIDIRLREKSKKYEFIERIGTTSPIDDELLAKVLFSLSEISLTILENKDKLNKDTQADECVHYFLNQLGYNYLGEIDLYLNWELERFRVLLEKNPKKLQGIIKIHERKIKEMSSVLK